MAVQKVGAIIWRTNRVKEVLDFYREIGIPLAEDTHEEPGHTPHYECDIADTHFAVFQMNEKEASERDTTGDASLMIGLAVDNIEVLADRLASMGILFRSQLEDTPWGKRVVVFDPDGRAVELYQPG